MGFITTKILHDVIMKPNQCEDFVSDLEVTSTAWTSLVPELHLAEWSPSSPEDIC